MRKLIREICITNKSDRNNAQYLEIDLSTKVLKEIFGPRVYDQLNRRWIEDDYEVIWVRMVTPVEAEILSRTIPLSAEFKFDHEHFEYALITSSE